MIKSMKIKVCVVILIYLFHLEYIIGYTWDIWSQETAASRQAWGQDGSESSRRRRQENDAERPAQEAQTPCQEIELPFVL